MGYNRQNMLLHIIKTRARWLLWVMAGKPKDDRLSFSKRLMLSKVGNEHNCETFVESGTYLGDTVAYLQRQFRVVISIELSNDLHQAACRRFSNKSNIRLLQGDSGQRLNDALTQIKGRALFWLDGHYSGGVTARGTTECPILAELDAIKSHHRNDHVIIIDDARLFGSNPDYPSIEKVTSILMGINPQYHVAVTDDCIQAIPHNA
jgi:hypothetical protein